MAWPCAAVRLARTSQTSCAISTSGQAVMPALQAPGPPQSVTQPAPV
jgi:hypothetical protein